MKFITGLVTGIALGAAGAVYYSVKSGRDLRTAYEDVRGDLDRRDYEALGQRIERGFADVQALVEERLGQIRSGAAAGLEEAEEAAEGSGAVDEAREFTDEATDRFAMAAEEVVEASPEAASDAADEARDEAEQASDPWGSSRS